MIFSYILEVYCNYAIIRQGLYILYPIFHWGLYCKAYGRAVSIADSLCAKKGNSSILTSFLLPEVRVWTRDFPLATNLILHVFLLLHKQ